ncbi:MAG TPA: sugar ABC transporter ATP-binding protein [Bacteroidota bacterium]|jgi:ribose transport system ATP-binding protein|nr:sugar ABC transporter ATP-binding protein [Bacteroidota bacterium]
MLLLRMSQITKKYPGVTALDNVDFELERGEVHVLIGENGAGKSTLMKVLSGAEVKNSGKIFLEDKEVSISNPIDAQKLGIVMIYQELNLVPQLSVGENIFLGREPKKKNGLIDWNKLYDESIKYLSKLSSDINPKKKVETLSVAEQQIVEVAKALSYNAKIIIMDEPTAALTTKEVAELFKVIKWLKSQNIGIIYISHRMEEIYEVGDRITILRDGKFVHCCKLNEITREEIIHKMVGRELDKEFPKKFFQKGREILRVENLSRKGVIDNISFSLYQGELLGFSGLVGAGRTELARLIFGADKKSSGKIYLEGKEVEINSPADAIKNGIALLTEDRNKQGLILDMSIAQNVTLSNLAGIMKGLFIDKKKEKDVVTEYSNDLNIRTPSIYQITRNLSGGNRQKVVLARWLFTNSKVVIFDEPTRGIDVGAKYEIYNLINNLLEKGIAVIMISSELPELLGMCDKIAVMHQGKIKGFLDHKDATQEKIMILATGGTI